MREKRKRCTTYIVMYPSYLCFMYDTFTCNIYKTHIENTPTCIKYKCRMHRTYKCNISKQTYLILFGMNQKCHITDMYLFFERMLFFEDHFFHEFSSI